MTRLSRYLFFEVLTPSLITLTVLTLILIMPKTLKLVDLWVNKGVSAVFLGEMILFVIPKFLIPSIPMALLIGILLALGRLSQDSEIVVLKAMGVSLYRILRPITLLIVLFTAFAYLLSVLWVPQARQHFARIIHQLESMTVLSIQPKTFHMDFPGLTLYVNERPNAGVLMKGVFIHDVRVPERPVTIVAEKSQLYIKTGQAGLRLYNGSRHMVKPNGDYLRLDFASYNVDLGVAMGTGSALEPAHKMQERSMKSLAKIMEEGTEGTERLHEAVLEWHRRLAFPAATLILGLLAIPFGIQPIRTGRGYGFAVAISLLVIHFLLMALGETLAKQAVVAPIVGFWAPNLLMSAAAVIFTVQAAREHPRQIVLWFSRGLETA